MGKKKGDPEPEEPAPVEVEAPVEVVEQTGRDQFVFVDGAKYGACSDPAHARYMRAFTTSIRLSVAAGCSCQRCPRPVRVASNPLSSDSPP